jgi:hypothetical protein
MEAFEVHTEATKILDNVLLVNVLRGDRIAGPMPSPFLIQSAHIIGNAHASKLGFGFDFTDQNKRQSEEIRRKGGMGQAAVVFLCGPRTKGPSAPTIFMFERYPLHEKPFGAESGYRHMAMWEGVLKGVANGDITVSDISHMVEPPLSDAGSTAELDSKFESMDI